MTGAGRFRTEFEVAEYDPATTLDSGQAFRWEQCGQGDWQAVVAGRWVRVGLAGPDRLAVSSEVDPGDWRWLRRYLAADDDPSLIRSTFPQDAALLEAVAAFPGLRVLRQDPWECLASFILSSSKQIVQIRQIVRLICEQFGEPVPVPKGAPSMKSFPGPEVLAGVGESALRACRMGFRARYLHGAATMVADGTVRLESLAERALAEARTELMRLPGVGRKIADCVLLFSCGFPAAFPVDVWILRALREIYFPRRPPRPARLLAFSETHFGPYGGHAQQVLFHHFRVRAGRVAAVAPGAGVRAHSGGDGD